MPEDASQETPLQESSDSPQSQALPSGKRRGAPKGNTNAAKRGGITARDPVQLTPFSDRRFGFALGNLPRGFEQVGRTCNKLRKDLEALVLEQRGEISIADAAGICSLVRWERHAQLACNLLRRDFTDMTPSERLSASREVATASTNRDKALAALRLDAADLDPLAGFAGLTLPISKH